MLSKNDYKILMIMYQHQCINELHSYTINKIKEITNLSIPKIRGTIYKFKKLNYTSEGLQSNHAKTYYVTRDGIEKINQLLNINIKE